MTDRTDLTRPQTADNERIVPRSTLSGIAAITSLLLAVVCVGSLLWRGVGQARSEPLRVAINPWPGYEFATLAREKGFFAEEGVDVRLLELSSLGDCRRTFERGQADGFFGTVTEVLESREQSTRQAQISMVVDFSDGADVVLAGPGIDGVSVLAGKKVGIENGSLNAFVLSRALEQSGLAWEDVEVVHLASIDMPKALASGEVAAVVTYPPMSLEIQRTGTGHAIFTSQSIPGEVVDVLSFDEKTLRTRGKDVAAFHRAFHRAQDYAAEHPEESYRIMAARQRITSEEFRQALTDGIRMLGRQDQQAFLGPRGSLREVVATTDRVLRQVGQLSGTADGKNAIAAVEGD